MTPMHQELVKYVLETDINGLNTLYEFGQCSLGNVL